MSSSLISRSGSRLRSLMAFATVALLTASPAFAASNAGKYQAVLGDCEGCHGKNLAGGVALETPFGKLVTPNITPDRETGIGTYSLEDFRKAMTQGVGPGGKLLYPAMPYPYYARMRDGDIAVLWSYIRSVKPVKQAQNVNQLRFPFNIRFAMHGWNLLYFQPTALAPDSAKSAVWNRGRYLVEGAAHCGACHAPKNFLGADKPVLTGGLLQGWYAPDLTGNKVSGIGNWSGDDIVDYLKTGRNAHSIASGPMADVVENSTMNMAGGDLVAIATYLADLPPSGGPGGGVDRRDMQLQAGARVYRMNCAACHGLDGKGSAIFPPLAGNANVTQALADTAARMVVAGSKAVATPAAPTGPAMPSFAWKLDDAQVANVLTYIRNNWGNSAPAVEAAVVERVRAEK
ncbi:MAG: cytochrome c, mono- and diheme variant family [Alphaproteobacteria bacterium]|nr:cytochrome c, mono- and diheme variant family [Alphaproteobacteria bacterium]